MLSGSVGLTASADSLRSLLGLASQVTRRLHLGPRARGGMSLLPVAAGRREHHTAPPLGRSAPQGRRAEPTFGLWWRPVRMYRRSKVDSDDDDVLAHLLQRAESIGDA